MHLGRSRMWLATALGLASTMCQANQAEPDETREAQDATLPWVDALGAGWASFESRLNLWLGALDFDAFDQELAGDPPASRYVVLPEWSSASPDSVGYEQDPLLQGAAFRSSGTVYFKGKAGYLNLHDQNRDELFSELSFAEMVTEIDRRRAFGVGAGFRIGPSERLEFEYVINKQDEQVFNVGYTF